MTALTPRDEPSDDRPPAGATIPDPARAAYAPPGAPADGVYDVVVVGGGAAGLSAALVLGRARRAVLVCDAGAPRNAPAHGVHGFLSRDGTSPVELVRIAREQLAPYDSVVVRDVAVRDARPIAAEAGGAPERLGFAVQLDDGTPGGTWVVARKLLLATGLRDLLPPLPNLERFWGHSAVHCPYCHGWELRDAPLAIYGNGATAMELALLLTTWSRDLVVLTDGPADFSEDERERLARLGIPLIEQPVRSLDGTGRSLETITFADGTAMERRGLFLRPPLEQRSSLPACLGLVQDDGTLPLGADLQSCVPGVYVAGDAARRISQVIAAAADGAFAAVAIDKALRTEDLDAELGVPASLP